MSEQYYVVRFQLWPLDEFAREGLGRHTSHSTYKAESEIDAINAALYYTRGRKSQFEMGFVWDVWGPFDDRGEAKAVQFEKAGEFGE